ncbi:hypothetical protein D5086_025912 [Populus alba]|uniref:Uncharacterized protein n=1 Tax=Populus alba TaxID=43335 RepID=A0ACC4B0H4_POPAL
MTHCSGSCGTGKQFEYNYSPPLTTLTPPLFEDARRKPGIVASLVLEQHLQFNIFQLSPSLSKLQNVAAEDDDEDLSSLEEETDAVPHGHGHDRDHDRDHYPDPDQFDEEFDNEDDLDNYSDLDDSELDSYKEPEIDDKDIIVLKEGNFSDFVTRNKFVTK